MPVFSVKVKSQAKTVHFAFIFHDNRLHLYLLPVTGPPVMAVTGELKDVYYSMGEEYIFRCAVEAFPEPVISWRYRKCPGPLVCSSAFQIIEVSLSLVC